MSILVMFGKIIREMHVLTVYVQKILFYEELLELWTLDSRFMETALDAAS
jgi:hypothetical protein